MPEPLPSRELTLAFGGKLNDWRPLAQRGPDLLDVEQEDVLRVGQQAFARHAPAHGAHEAANVRVDLPVENVVVLFGERSSSPRGRDDVVERGEVGRSVLQLL